MVKKALWALVLLSFLGTARCYNADLASALGGVPVLGPIVQPPAKTPDYVKSIGTPAAVTIPESDLATFFPAEAPADPYDAKRWKDIAGFLSAASTNAGWVESCKKAAAIAGSDRASSPLIGALACSSDATVTQMQQFAAHVLAIQASVALWMKGELNGSTGAIHARQAEVRVVCATGVVSRQGPASPWVDVCAKALDASFTSGDGPATFSALEAAYAAAAAEIARLDPEIDAEPGFFGASATPTP